MSDLVQVNRPSVVNIKKQSKKATTEKHHTAKSVTEMEIQRLKSDLACEHAYRMSTEAINNRLVTELSALKKLKTNPETEQKLKSVLEHNKELQAELQKKNSLQSLREGDSTSKYKDLKKTHEDLTMKHQKIQSEYKDLTIKHKDLHAKLSLVQQNMQESADIDKHNAKMYKDMEKSLEKHKVALEHADQMISACATFEKNQGNHDIAESLRESLSILKALKV